MILTIEEAKALWDKVAKLEKLGSKNSNANEGMAALAKAAKIRYKLKTTGVKKMVAFSFNAQQYKPNYGGGGGNLPVGKYKGVIVDSATEKTSSGNGGFLALTLSVIEGPMAGQTCVDRLNLHNTNPKAVEIANEQMSAYCHVLNVFNVQDTAQLHNIPFCFEIGYQKGNEPTAEKPEGGYTEVKRIADVNGNAPGKAGSGSQPTQQPPAQQQTPPPAQVTASSGWGERPAVDTGVAMPAEQSVTAPQQGNGGGWGGPAAQGGAPAAGGSLPPGWGA